MFGGTLYNKKCTNKRGRTMAKTKIVVHNEDIAACTNDKCPKRQTCLRWLLGTNKDPYQTFFDGTVCKGKFYVESKE